MELGRVAVGDRVHMCCNRFVSRVLCFFCPFAQLFFFLRYCHKNQTLDTLSTTEMYCETAELVTAC